MFFRAHSRLLRSQSLLQIDFSSDYGPETKRAKKRYRTYMYLFQIILQNFKIAHNLQLCKISFNMQKFSLFM